MLISSRGLLADAEGFLQVAGFVVRHLQATLGGPFGVHAQHVHEERVDVYGLGAKLLSGFLTEAGKFRDISGQYSLMVIVQDEHGVTM